MRHETSNSICYHNGDPVSVIEIIGDYACIEYHDKSGKIESINDHIIKIPDDEVIPDVCVNIHGITNEIMRRDGENIVDVLMEFKRDLSNSKIMVAHNLEFDTSIISVELLRNNLRNAMYFYRGEKYCTMRKTKHLFKRWPKLINLHKTFFKTTPTQLHNSLIDVYVCFRCFCFHYYGYDPVYNNKTIENNSNNQEFRRVFDEILN